MPRRPSCSPQSRCSIAVTDRYFQDNQEAQVVPADAQGGGAAHALDTGAADRLWEYAEDTVRACSKAQ
jgi:hypothetical protein